MEQRIAEHARHVGIDLDHKLPRAARDAAAVIVARSEGDAPSVEHVIARVEIGSDRLRKRALDVELATAGKYEARRHEHLSAVFTLDHPVIEWNRGEAVGELAELAELAVPRVAVKHDSR